MTWGLHFGTASYIYANGGPYGYPWHSDPLTYVAPSVWLGWGWH